MFAKKQPVFCVFCKIKFAKIRYIGTVRVWIENRTHNTEIIMFTVNLRVKCLNNRYYSDFDSILTWLFVIHYYEIGRLYS